MGDAAKRLETATDTGLGTQRVQEDVIRRLDQLLASLERNQSSQSQQQSQSDSDQQSQRNQPNQQKRSQPTQGKETKSGDGNTDWEGPPRQDGPLRPGLEAARAAWGSLPARVRDMLLQGSSDRFSSRYDELTRAYYKRLAEEKK
jgi:Mg-chelatase subunit ChlI